MENKKVIKPKKESVPKKSKPQRAAKPKQEKKKTPKTPKTSKTSKNKSTKLKFENGELELDEESYSKKVNTLISKIKNKYLFDSDDPENKIRLGWK
jgi:hypothetical protein